MKPFLLINPEHPGSYYAFFYLIAFLTGFVLLLIQGRKRNFPVIPWMLLIATAFLFFMIGCRLITFSTLEWTYVMRFEPITCHALRSNTLFNGPERVRRNSAEYSRYFAGKKISSVQGGYDGCIRSGPAHSVGRRALWLSDGRLLLWYSVSSSLGHTIWQGIPCLCTTGSRWSAFGGCAIYLARTSCATI